MSVLTSRRVGEVFNNCLFREGEDTTDHIAAEGITCTVGFHPERVQAMEEYIHELLDELPLEFHEGTGDGMSFLAGCMDKDGRQWGEHINVEQLFQLGLAIDRVLCLLPRDVWHLCPGGMPYYVVRKRQQAPAIGIQTTL